MDTVISFVSPLKAFDLISVTEFGTTRLLSVVQSANALLPMVVKPDCKLTLFSFVHPRKVLIGMRDTVLGMVTEASAVQFLNTPVPNACTPVMEAELNCVQPIKALAFTRVTVLGSVIPVSAVQLANALIPIQSRPAPMDTEVNPVQPENALFPIASTLPPMETDVTVVLFLKALAAIPVTL